MDPASQAPTTTAATISATVNHIFGSDIDGGNEEEEEEEEEEDCCDVEAWETLRKSLREVQSVLDHNRRLIQQANENHRSKLPQNLTRNVGLIREINANISSVVGLYSDLSTNFSTIVKQRRAIAAAEKAVKKAQS